MNLDRRHGLAALVRARRCVGGTRWSAGVAVLAAVLVATACTPIATSTTSATASSAPGLQDLQNAFVDTVHTVLPSVVEIQTSTGLGSGVIFDHAGDIVTNNHVVGTARTFSVLVNGSALSGRLVGTYPASDLAVITVNSPTPLTPAKFGPPSSVQVGDVVLAMGNPLGLQGSTSEGIVSATGRKVVEPTGDGATGATLSDVIQTSAAINPGNSGGALVNLSGEVIGIPTLTATDPQIGGTAPGIGFAIPAGTVTDVAQQLIAYGRVITPPK
jgi:putative serine protease PepD